MERLFLLHELTFKMKSYRNAVCNKSVTKQEDAISVQMWILSALWRLVISIFMYKERENISVILCFVRYTSGSPGKLEMLWEHDSEVIVSTAFLSLPKLSLFLSISIWNLTETQRNYFSVSFREYQQDEKEIICI